MASCSYPASWALIRPPANWRARPLESRLHRQLKNIKHILDTAGTGIEHVCRATIYLKNVEDFKEVDARYAEAFIGSVKPARVAFGNNMIPKARSWRSTPSRWSDSNVFPAGPSARMVCADGPPRIVRRIPGNVSLGGGARCGSATRSRERCAGIVGRWSVPQ